MRQCKKYNFAHVCIYCETETKREWTERTQRDEKKDRDKRTERGIK